MRSILEAAMNEAHSSSEISRLIMTDLKSMKGFAIGDSTPFDLLATWNATFSSKRPDITKQLNQYNDSDRTSLISNLARLIK